MWTRPDLARATHAKAMREQLGIRTVAETDDNYLTKPMLNVFMRSNGFDAKARLDHMKAVFSMNAIVFSTGDLRDVYYRGMRDAFGRRGMPELHVCGNHVFEEDWPDPVPRDGPLRVGWMGSPSHVWDVDLAWPALMYAKQQGCETWMIGYDPVNPDYAVTAPRAKDKVEQWRKVGYRHVGWQDLQGKRQQLPVDIGLCPLLTNEFTLGKSDIKAVEYTIAGAAVVAQSNPVFNRNWVHGETALLANSPAGMLRAVDRLIRDDNLRERLTMNAQQYVREERGGDRIRQEWTEAISG